MTAEHADRALNRAALTRWREIREELAEDLKTMRPRSKAAAICEQQLRTATTAVMALEAMQ